MLSLSLPFLSVSFRNVVTTKVENGRRCVVIRSIERLSHRAKVPPLLSRSGERNNFLSSVV